MIKTSCYLEQQNTFGDDALLLIEKGDSIWFCIADGSGGSGYGAIASKLVTSGLDKLSRIESISEARDFENFLRKLDQDIQLTAQGGESSAIIGRIKNQIIVGASVGDCELWLYNKDHKYELTALQLSKPLLGSGKSSPIGFGPTKLEFVLLMGSDGLFKYAKLDDITKAVRSRLSAEQISSLAKIQTGKLQDDISVSHIQI